MTATDLATHSLAQARLRVQVLPRYLELGGHNIVIREAQEAVENARFVLETAELAFPPA